ncbi:hypothetical protein SAMN05443637_10518 [Pseudonocardia thermophila]|uniref:Uncharacterized protein n=1 Tax=Pseudonocardia thermophila TaxID=1848 RepID=A0A1M6RJC4_PSETH|nr:hypothetical protein [Pseudonocardia thermophila]SHK32467.1 hypothetical protein SAMN05443637_10518 [Pseudonocardia thermophila]
MPLPRRAVAVIVLVALTAVVGVLAALSLLDPFHLRHARWYSLGLVGLAIVLGTAVFAVALRGGLRGFVLGVGVAALAAWGVLTWFVAGIASGGAEVRTVVDGDRRLVVLRGGAFAADPVYSVVVRSGAGPFEQQSVVYQGRADGPEVTDLRFSGEAVLVQVGRCGYRSEIDPLTLEVRPVHVPLLAGAC